MTHYVAPLTHAQYLELVRRIADLESERIELRAALAATESIPT